MDRGIKIGGQKVASKTLLLIVADCVLVGLAILAATALRLWGVDSLSGYFSRPNAIIRFLLVLAVCGLSLYYYDLYDFQVVKRRSEMFVRLLQALGTACLVLSVLYYADPDLSTGRGVTLLAAPPIFVLTLGMRLLVNSKSWTLGDPLRVLIVGTGPNGISLVREIIERPEHSLKVIGFLDERGENIGRSLVNPGIIGAVSDLERVVTEKEIDRVVLSLAERRGRTPVRQLLHLKFKGVVVEDAHTVYERITGRIPLDCLSPSWLILSDGFRKSDFLLSMKRMLDVIVSLALLLLTLPLMGIVAVFIWMESGRPILFRQTRVGLWGRPFQMLKFRSMVHGAESQGAKWTTREDQRATRFGRIIRRFHLDELPQLFNVLRGDMSLIGPRPEQPEFCTLLEEKLPFFALRHSVRPGITGWAQVKYEYGASIEQARKKLEHDLFYIKHLSITLDLAILFETVKVMVSARGSR